MIILNIGKQDCGYCHNLSVANCSRQEKSSSAVNKPRLKSETKPNESNLAASIKTKQITQKNLESSVELQG
jgi:hypothetical protein